MSPTGLRIIYSDLFDIHHVLALCFNLRGIQVCILKLQTNMTMKTYCIIYRGGFKDVND